ncbi:hypothetical protein NST63_24235 [Heyndrickxia sp. FSL W8-0496]|uniref:hypothetical protein n=1 Tax=Heyndrickxia sp. FSL W8-0496 TaxID=2954702 RepID=UPI0030FD1775
MPEPQLPIFLNAYHIKNLLKISYSEATEILEQNSLPIFIIGQTQRVLNKDFFKWLQLNKNLYNKEEKIQ